MTVVKICLGIIKCHKEKMVEIMNLLIIKKVSEGVS